MRLGGMVLCAAVAATACDGPADGFVAARFVDGPDDAVGGPMATARAGDVLIENDRVRFVVQGPGRDFGLNPYGGNILDADRVREGDGRDRFGGLGLLVNLKHTFAADDVEIVDDGSGGAAEVRFTGHLVLQDYLNVPFMADDVIQISDGFDSDEVPPFEVERTYRLEPGQDSLRIDTTLTNTGAEQVPLIVAHVIDAGGEVERYLSARRPGDPTGVGFTRTLVGTPERIGLVSPAGVSYGIAPADSSGNVLVDAVGVLVLARDARATDLFDYPFSAQLTAPPGEPITTTSWFLVGDGDVASLDRLWFERTGRETGRIEGRAVMGGGGIRGPRIAVVPEGSEHDYTVAFAKSEGRFDVRVPPGTYQLHPHLPGYPRAEGAPVTVEVSAGSTTEVEVPLGINSRITYTVRDADGDPLPARVTVLGVDPAPPLSMFGDNSVDPHPPGVTHIDFTTTGEGEFMLEPGEWRVVVSRGLEYDLYVEDVTLPTNQSLHIDAVLHRVVDTTGYLSADFHVHAASSSDSTVLMRDRVAAFAAEGVEYFAATEHEVVVDPSTTIDELGLDDWIGAMPGQEITTAGFGHWNAFPLPVDPTAHNGGAIAFSNGTHARSLDDLYALARQAPGQEIVQVNHPRRAPVNIVWQEYFSQIDLTFDDSGPAVGPDAIDPASVRIESAWGEPTGFDAIEVYNWANVGALVDWWNYLNFGHALAGTGNTDTHSVRLEPGGFPRTFVHVGVDEPRLVGREDVVAAVRGQALTVAGGAFVTIRARSGQNSAAEGETLVPGGDPIQIEVRVQSPTWVPWDDVELYENGVLVDSAPGAGDSAPVVASADGGERRDLTLTFDVSPIGDAWYIALVRADPGRSLFPWVTYNTTSEPTREQLWAFRVDGAPRPMSFTNPTWIDLDGDGEVTPSRLVVAPGSVDIYDEETFDRRTDISPWD